MILHLITVTAALAQNPFVLIVALIDNPMVVLLLLSLSWLVPSLTDLTD